MEKATPVKYPPGEILDRLALGEDSGWEFTEVRFAGERLKGPKRNDIADEMAAFANSDGGVVVFGATDAGEVPAGFDKSAVPETGLPSLDEALWKKVVSVHGARAPGVALEKMGLLTRDERGAPRASVAGLLLCARAPEEWLDNACVVATCYRGADRASMQLDAETICGPLDRQIAAAVAFVLRNMRVAARKDPGRVDLPQFSDSAVFEAVVNGSVVLAEGSGQVPGLRATVNPVRDEHDRTRLYVSGAAVNEGAEQPVPFGPADEMRLTDSVGGEAVIRVPAVVGTSAVVEYEAPS